MALQQFANALRPETVHIDYLRIRCGEEDALLGKIEEMTTTRMAFISFAEWDVVLFIVSNDGKLYSRELIATYEDPTITRALSGSAGYYNYVWDHEINRDWQARLFDRTEIETGTTHSRSDVLMLVSLRFNDRFRCEYGLGAELLFCNFLQRLKAASEGLDLCAFQSFGWNDMTVVLYTPAGEEHLLLEALHRIRYCTRRDLALGDDASLVLAATYSHVLGNLRRYVATPKSESKAPKFSFGALGKDVSHAQLLVRVAPSMEPGVRHAYKTVAASVRESYSAPLSDQDWDLAIELGHYNFSANIKWAFDLDPHAPVDVIQGLRVKIRDLLPGERKASTFPETTTKISFNEKEPGPVASRATVPLVDKYEKIIDQLLTAPVGSVVHAREMTRHRMAVFFASISAHLADPVRGSVVGHICRFLASTYETVVERMAPHEIEDLCQVLEYALNQATDGLSQFQHDANALGLSGRGGYVRVIHAMEQWVADFVDGLHMNLTPLVTFGMRSARTAVKHRIDVPFNTAFMPVWWPVLLHEIGHICWYDNFGWRLDSIAVSKVMIEADASNIGEDDQRQDYLSARAIAEELFPNYLVLNIVALGDCRRLDALMLESELRAVPQRSLARTFHLRVALHALLALHSTPAQSVHDLMSEIPEQADVVSSGALAAKLERVAIEWWKRWKDLRDVADGQVNDAVREASSSLEKVAKTTSAISAGSGRRAVVAIGTAAFNGECARGVRAAIKVMAALAIDLESQKAMPVDLGYAAFGEVLVRIDWMKHRAAKAVACRDTLVDLAKAGRVLANVPSATSLASVLAQLNASDRHDHTLNMWLLLSFWHRNITSMMLDEAPQFRETLKKMGIITDVIAAGSAGR